MKRYKKLLTAVLLLIMALVMVISTSYAWMTMSTNPVTQGIQITIAGSHTVLVAPDISVVENGQVLHYPGAFSDSMNFSHYQQYSYLQTLGGLLPVSTADGLTWYIPEYYKQNDVEVENGQAFAGQIRPTWDFQADNRLTFANLSPEQTEDLVNGSYVYMDFWVVAPVDGYKLRVSTGDEGNGGSFVIDLLEPETTTTDGITVYSLTKENSQAAACMRIGFLVNEDTLLDNSMLRYTQSSDYVEKYTRLQGVYSEPGLSALNSVSNRFTIYEPNGDWHPSMVTSPAGQIVKDGQYIITEPLGQGGMPTSVQDRLTVQLTNRWLMAGEETSVAQMFRTFTAGKDLSGETEQSLKKKFYIDTLQYQLYPYVIKGNFLSSTSNLYAVSGSDKIAEAEQIINLQQAGATEDVYMTQLTGCVPQRIRMFIWLEGQDVDCINSAATSGFAISIELAGSNAS